LVVEWAREPPTEEVRQPVPTRRLFVALTVLVLGVFGVGLVTALNRAADDAQPTAAPSPTTPAYVPPLETVDPTPAPDTTSPPPTTAPSQPPPTSGTGGNGGTPGTGGNGNTGGARPNMPNTGAPAALGLAAAALLTAALGVRRAAR
jgi:hypothetical protein